MVLRRNQICQNDIFFRSGQRTSRDSNVCMSINKNRLGVANAYLKIKLRSILYNVCATAVGGRGAFSFVSGTLYLGAKLHIAFALDAKG